MNWEAPDVVHVLELRLKTARLELMEDPRIKNAHEARSDEPLRFLAQLIEEKMAAAARFGLEAAEASLRLWATDALLAAGVPLEITRERLELAGRQLLHPPAPVNAGPPRAGLRPGVAAALVLGAWTLACVAAWLVYSLHPLFCAVAVGAGGIPAVGVHGWKDGRLATMKQQLAGEMPSSMARHYMDVLRKSVEEYGREVEAIARAESRRH